MRLPGQSIAPSTLLRYFPQKVGINFNKTTVIAMMFGLWSILGCQRSDPKPQWQVINASDAEIKEETHRIAPLLSAIFAQVTANVRAGVSTQQLDEIAAAGIKARGLRSCFVGFMGYPAHTTTAVNEEIINTLPSKRRLRDGDLLKLQIGVMSDKAFALRAWTYPVGSLREADRQIMDVGQLALTNAVKAAAQGNRVGDVSAALQSTVETAGLKASPDWVGHRVGQKQHHEPPIPSDGKAGTGWPLNPGHVYSLSVIVHAGDPEPIVLADGWNIVAADKKRSVHFSQMIIPGKMQGLELLSPQVVVAEPREGAEP